MSLYKQNPDGPWWVSITHPGVPRVRRSTETKDYNEARRIHDEIKADLWITAPKEQGKQWSDAKALWLAKKPRTDSEKQSLAKLGKTLGDPMLTSITRQSTSAALSFAKTPGTFMRYRAMVMAILNVAKDEGWLRVLPKMETRSDRKTPTREWITPKQWGKLYKELPPHLRGPAKFALATGLRRANVFGLRWADVDLARKHIFVCAADTKSDDALSVPLNDDALEVLAHQRLKKDHPEYVFAYRGKPIKDPKKAFKDACIRAGVGRATPSGGYEGFTWHGLRHTWATWHIQNGTPLEVLRILGGWSDLRMVTHYAHHAPGFVASYANNVRKK